jgi:hypothetical protein
MVTATLLYRALLVSAGTACLTCSVMEIVQAAAIDFSEPTIDFTNGISWTLGFTFRTNQEITVTRLGFYDDQKNGLAASHIVSILDEADQRVVSGTVQRDDPLTSWFRYTNVNPTVLAAGKTFRIVTITGTENYTWNPSGFTVNPAISFLGDAFRPINSPLPQPSFSSSGVIGWFGPNFDFDEITAIPSPTLLPGLIGMGLAALRKRRENG